MTEMRYNKGPFGGRDLLGEGVDNLFAGVDDCFFY